MAGAKQPIELVIANGKKHLTKKEIEKRMAEEIKAPNGNIVAPSYLPAKLTKRFNQYADQLIACGIMTDLDCDALARYLLSEQQYLSFTQQLAKATTANNWLVMEKMAALQDKSCRQCHMLASALGLTISSRCRLVAPKLEKEIKNKFKEFANEENEGD